MRAETTSLRIAPRLTFAAPDGSAVELLDVSARVTYVGERLGDVWLVFELAPEAWARVDGAGWFRMPAAVRGPCFGGAFDPARPVQVQARLVDEVQVLVAVLTVDVWDVGGCIRGASVAPDVHRTESWAGVYVTQARGRIRAGFATASG